MFARLPAGTEDFRRNSGKEIMLASICLLRFISRTEQVPREQTQLQLMRLPQPHDNYIARGHTSFVYSTVGAFLPVGLFFCLCDKQHPNRVLRQQKKHNWEDLGCKRSQIGQSRLPFGQALPSERTVGRRRLRIERLLPGRNLLGYGICDAGDAPIRTGP